MSPQKLLTIMVGAVIVGGMLCMITCVVLTTLHERKARRFKSAEEWAKFERGDK